ncbi:hypothetical protein L1987_64600 [Smallanthus sonchifolius]|uniref:Uncharacterized protein n=1 Tax=Smallanthus sonchifolius TaxID=185202 RepID=A0ACB9BS71_9ASTR|nr:hypothetical protein L1987_64600 [Smallanthus sonchifolius]
MVGASMQNMTIAELIFTMDQEIEDTIKAFAEGEYGVAIRKDDEAKNPSVELSPETTKTFDFGPFSPCIEDQTDQIAVQVRDSIPTHEELWFGQLKKTAKGNWPLRIGTGKMW